ncbi:hypothetical protein [Streptomyces clavuligerus]|uniref:Uncharacterized protein n=1 Tax=Streptomyces clavuligerus TaxID=1901 RepID=B5H3S0_STRCL|nr:hypothetical protein [Streptomyces clavuligerus]ANW18515.1 hypothetical protein BB341_09855 [Streptomyces clavuligerus]AXU13073.1 hypothetical protein D1794_10195 [Streptomyces clavuligerus]EDY53216.1 conserved hypothetical protein [Streptomyces clavuligerus]EFG08840.1 Hypothetical protein SCLAV_3768 [Streptomyces clavuligerus]MBY6303009.1 hypothetical protein [Streptomyces clavuligerus]
MNEPNPYQAEGEPEYQWGPPQPYGYPQQGPGYGDPHAGPPAHPGYAPTQPGYTPTQPAGTPVPGAVAGYGPAPLAPMSPAVTIGDITVVGDQIITPAGTMPLKGAVWNAVDLSRTSEKIPTYAIVLAVVFSLACLVGLFFLLMKEKETSGYIQVSVASGGKHHTTMIPAHGPEVFQQVMAQVGYARTLSV